jgi:hypothetical protein
VRLPASLIPGSLGIRYQQVYQEGIRESGACWGLLSGTIWDMLGGGACMALVPLPLDRRLVPEPGKVSISLLSSQPGPTDALRSPTCMCACVCIAPAVCAGPLVCVSPHFHRADGKGEAWDLPAIAEGTAFNGGALGISNLKPVEADSSYSWWVVAVGCSPAVV